MNLRALSALIVVTMASTALAEFRTIDGVGNNRRPGQITWGSAESDVIRFGYPADYPDGFGDEIYGVTSTPVWPNARDVSNALFTQSTSIYNNRNLSDWVVQWGQFLTHDMDLTTNGNQYDTLSDGSVGDFSIAINDPDDPLGPNPLPFHRSNYNPATGQPGLVPGPLGPRPNWREQINSVTSFIDASNVYGSDAQRAAALRTFSGGKLVTTAGGLLPGLNTAGLENDDPFGQGESQFLAGDVRANEQVGLTSTHALFVREHNRLAGLLQENNPTMTDELLYQTARKIVGAEMQAITYNEFLPALMGNSAPNPNAYNYNPALIPSITNSFATAFFRFGHSMQSSETLLVDNDELGQGTLSLRDAFFNPSILQDSPETVELVLKGLSSQVSQENDLQMIDDLRNFLFGPPGAGGLDLAALDIQRGRDHGLLDFNAFRPAYGLPPLPSLQALTSDPDVQAALRELYGNVNSIDAFVGMLAEDHLPGMSVGPMLRASLRDQFTRLRDGDRFFYTGDPDLQASLVTDVIDLDSLRLSNIIRWNTDITNIQDDVFFTTLPGDFNEDGVVNRLDLAVWSASFRVDAGGDADWDGDTDGEDFLIWQHEFRTGIRLTAATAVPEPMSGILCAGMLAACGMWRPRRAGA